VSEGKFSKCEGRGRKKNVSVEFRVFEKKGIERKKFRRKKIKVFWKKGN
jgi:hypothetical protein